MALNVKNLNTRLRLEALEHRLAPAVYVSPSGDLTISGTSGNDSAVVTAETHLGVPVYKVVEVGATARVPRADVTTGFVVFYGYEGNDFFSNSAPQLRAQAFGDGGDDVLIGGGRDDHFWGGGGFDVLQGKGGNDTLHGGFGGFDSSGNALYGGLGSDTLQGGSKNDVMFGEAGADKLYGLDGNDSLYGGAGRDELRGQNGDDTLDGGAGVVIDLVWGGAGRDRFKWGDWAMDYRWFVDRLS